MLHHINQPLCLRIFAQCPQPLQAWDITIPHIQTTLNLTTWCDQRFQRKCSSNDDRGSNALLLQLSILGTFQRTAPPFFSFSRMTFLEKGFWNTYFGSNNFLGSLFWNIFLLDKPFRNTFPKAKNPFWKAYSGVQVLLSEWAFRKPNIAFWNTPSGISFLTFASEMNVPEKGYSGTPFPKAYSLRKAYSRIYLLLPERPF